MFLQENILQCDEPLLYVFSIISQIGGPGN